MAEETKTPESEDEKKPESPEAEKPEEKKEESPKDGDNEKKASDDKQADENGEGAESKSEEKPEPDEKAPPDVPEMSETDRLKAENLTLKTQLEAVKIGFNPDCIEDAVVLAENIVKRDGSDITTALQAVAKKYPDWKSNGKDNSKGKGGFKVGADTPKDEKMRTTADLTLFSESGRKSKKGLILCQTQLIMLILFQTSSESFTVRNPSAMRFIIQTAISR